MLTLGTRGLPATSSQLENALREGLAPFQAPKLAVEITGDFPRLDGLRIDLSGGRLPSALPPNRTSQGSVRQELSVEALDLRAQPLLYENARAHVEMHASGVQLQLRGGEGNEPAMLDLAGAKAGEFIFDIAHAELEALIKTIAQQAAQAHGVTIQRTNLQVESTGARSVKFRADVQAQKLFMQTTLTLRGALAVDDTLEARLSDLSCSGTGVIGSLASNFLQPYMLKLQGRAFPLASFALRGLRVRDVTLGAGDPLRVSATFGS